MEKMRDVLDYLPKRSVSSVSYWKIEIKGLNKSDMEVFGSKITNQIRKYKDITIIGFGINDGIKSSIFFQQTGDILRILTTEIQILVTELGLRSKNIAEISALVTNEILSEISVENEVNTGSFHLNKGITFAGCFVINERIKHKMIVEYSKKIKDIISKLKGTKNKKLQRFSKILREKGLDVATGILIGIITEASIRVILEFQNILHRISLEETVGLDSLYLDKNLANIIKSKKEFTVTKFSYTEINTEWKLIQILNTLSQLGFTKLVDKNLGLYRGTGKKSVPEILGATRSSLGLKPKGSKRFRQFLSPRLDKDKDADWSVNYDKNVYSIIFLDDTIY